MIKKYRQLNQEDRDRIFCLLSINKDQSDIARIIGRDKSTISRELKRNLHLLHNQYLPDTAQRKANRRKELNRKRNYLEKDAKLRKYVLKKLRKGWSPELIAGRAKKLNGHYYNKESLYQYIYSLPGRKQNLKQFLRQAHRIRHKKYGRKFRKDYIINRIDIALRPEIVAQRSKFGHWEGDSMIFQKHSQALATQVERKTRFTIALKAEGKDSKYRAKIINRRFGKLPVAARRTMTFDNGLEFANHETITASIGMKIFFAKAYASWQRGTNENANGLIRWFLPRNTDLNQLTSRQIYKVISLINNRPKKCLGFKTPREAFNEELKKLKN